jgi:hypothetical protein
MSTHPRTRSLAGAILSLTVLGLAAPDAGAAAAAGQPTAPAGTSGAPGLTVPWSQRAITATVAGRTVTSDLGPGRTERWIGAVVAAEALVAELLGTNALPARATPPQTLLLFADREDFARELRGRYGEVAEGAAATSFLFDDVRVTAATVPALPAPPEGVVAPAPAPAERDIAAAAGDLLAVAAAAAFDRPFEDDLAPALASAIELLAAESIVLDDGIHPGHPAASTLVAAQVVVRDRAPDPIAILTVDARAWGELEEDVRADATLTIWSLLQFASTREGRGAVAVLRSLAERVNAGDRPETAVLRAADERTWRTLVTGWRRWIESATPDPTAMVVTHAEALAAGLRELAADGVVPADLDAAATALADRGFVWRAIRQGVPVEIAVEGPATFTFEEDMGSRRRPELKLMRPRSGTGRADGQLPPGVEITGLRLGRVMVSWERSEDGPVRRMIVR